MILILSVSFLYFSSHTCSNSYSNKHISHFFTIFLSQTLENTIKGIEGVGVASTEKSFYQYDVSFQNVGHHEMAQVICGPQKMF